MTTHSPYQITHIYLSQQLTPPQLNCRQQGNYLVFWWKEFAIGHLFLEPGAQIQEKEYYQKLIEAITPAVTFYARKATVLTSGWPHFLQNQQTAEFTAFMERIFSGFAPKETPEQVPVSVIICTRNRAAALKKCLDALKKMVCQPEEIIIIDNARENAETEDLIRTYPDVKYYQEPVPGLSFARNTGIAKASCAVIAFTDDDVLVHQDWIFQVWQTFKDPETMAFTGLVIASELESETQLIFEKYWSFNRGYTDLIYNGDYFKKTLPKGPPVWKIGAGANMAFRKEVFDQVGLFDERLGAGASGCNEDSEMWYRILAKAHTIHYNPRALVFHEHRRELHALKKQIFNYMRGHAAAALIQQQQHKKAGYIRHLSYMLLVTYSRSILKGFPRYSARYKTLWAQIIGLLSGVAYYYKNQQRSKTTN